MVSSHRVIKVRYHPGSLGTGESLLGWPFMAVGSNLPGLTCPLFSLPCGQGLHGLAPSRLSPRVCPGKLLHCTSSAPQSWGWNPRLFLCQAGLCHCYTPSLVVFLGHPIIRRDPNPTHSSWSRWRHRPGTKHGARAGPGPLSIAAPRPPEVTQFTGQCLCTERWTHRWMDHRWGG